MENVKFPPNLRHLLEEKKCVKLITTSDFKPSYWHQVSTEPYLPLTIGQLIGQAAEKWRDDEAVVYPHEHLRMSFKDIKEKADEIAAGLLNLGLKPGDVLAIWGFNCSVMYLTSAAAQRAGLIAVYIYPNGPLRDVLSYLKRVKANALVIIQPKGEDETYNRLLNTVTDIFACTKNNSPSVKLPDLRRIITSSDTAHPGTFDWKKLSEMSTIDDIEKINILQDSIQPDDTAMILFTSGSTGDSKGVLLSHHMLVNNMYLVAKRMGIHNDRHRVHNPSHFCYITVILFSFLSKFLFGWVSVISDGQYDIKSAIHTIEKERCSFVYLPPTAIADIMRYVQDHHLNLHYPKVILFGGARVTDNLVEEVKKVLPIKYFMMIFGGTEGGILSLNVNVQAGSAMTGKLFDHLEAKIVDKEGIMVPMGKPGELWVRRSCIMKGYLDDEEMTARAITSNGWFMTKDQCILEEDGTLKFLGRINDRINKSGRIIYPMELENILISYNLIQDVCVFGVPDERLEEEICAFLQTKKDQTLTIGDVTKFCKENMAPVLVPRYIRFIEEMPKNSNGKVNKRAMLDIIKKDKEYIQYSA